MFNVYKSCVVSVLNFVFSNFYESQQKQHLVYKLRHLYDAMKIHNWQLLTTFSNFRISAIESTTEIRNSCLRTLRVWSGFQYMSSNLLMHSERLEGYLIVLLLLHDLQKKNSDRKRADFNGILSHGRLYRQKLIYIYEKFRILELRNSWNADIFTI